MPHSLSTILSSGQPLPPDDVMIAKALEILNHSPHGQQLVDFVAEEKVQVRIIATPQPVTYLPETRTVYLGFNRNNPVGPAVFVMMLTGVLREAEQEVAGIKLPGIKGTKEEHVKAALAKQEDKLWYMCTAARELDSQSIFTDYGFLDALRKMGYSSIVDLFLKQENA